MSEKPDEILLFNLVAKFDLFHEPPPEIIPKDLPLQIPLFQLIPGFETVCLFIIGLWYGDPEDSSLFYFDHEPLRSREGFVRMQTVDVSEAFARFFRYHLMYELHHIIDLNPLDLLTDPAIAAFCDRSDTLLENLIRLQFVSASWYPSVLEDPQALEKIRFLMFRSHDWNEHSFLFAVGGISFGPEILHPIARMPGLLVISRLCQKSQKHWKRHWKILKQLASAEQPNYIIVNWFICSCKGRMSLCIVRSGRLIQLADGYQESFPLIDGSCDFFLEQDLRLYVVAYGAGEISSLRSPVATEA
jgi:hypothetical protein